MIYDYLYLTVTSKRQRKRVSSIWQINKFRLKLAAALCIVLWVLSRGGGNLTPLFKLPCSIACEQRIHKLLQIENSFYSVKLCTDISKLIQTDMSRHNVSRLWLWLWCIWVLYRSQPDCSPSNFKSTDFLVYILKANIWIIIGFSFQTLSLPHLTGPLQVFYGLLSFYIRYT